MTGRAYDGPGSGAGPCGAGPCGAGPCGAASGGPFLGDLVMLLLAGTLSGLRDRLAVDGYARHSELVADLVDVVDDYLLHRELGTEGLN